jgi:hypothetical protein
MLCWHQNIQQVTTWLNKSGEGKAQFKAELRRALNTHSFYYSDEFLVFKDD